MVSLGVASSLRPGQSTAPPLGGRPHTGRQRNEAARSAILNAALELLRDAGSAGLTIDAIAAAAGVGKQTIYRWWPSKGAVVLEAMTERAGIEVPVPDCGTVTEDLISCLGATFRNASKSSVSRILRFVMAEAQHDPWAAEVLGRFTAQRRNSLRVILERGQTRNEISESADVDLLIDQAFGFLWYRMLVGHAPLTRRVARDLAEGLVKQSIVL
jgi:AcrR family transcriptional regulator